MKISYFRGDLADISAEIKTTLQHPSFIDWLGWTVKGITCSGSVKADTSLGHPVNYLLSISFKNIWIKVSKKKFIIFWKYKHYHVVVACCTDITTDAVVPRLNFTHWIAWKPDVVCKRELVLAHRHMTSDYVFKICNIFLGCFNPVNMFFW